MAKQKNPIEEDIARLKLPDLNAASLDSAIQTVKGTARSMGIEVV